MRALTCCFVLLAGFGLASCSSERDEKAHYDERQQIRHQGQHEANRAADAGRSDLDRATAPK